MILRQKLINVKFEFLVDSDSDSGPQSQPISSRGPSPDVTHSLLRKVALTQNRTDHMTLE